MHFPDVKWYQALQVRRSRRRFNGESLSKEDFDHLTSFIDNINSTATGFRAVLINSNADEVFKGFIGSYGKVSGAPAYVAFVGAETAPNVDEKVGYYGESIILEATAMGVGTCWIAGFFDREKAKSHFTVEPSEKVFAVTPVGYTGQELSLGEKVISGIARSHKRKPLEALCAGLPESSWPKWARTGLEAARVAPSAVNRQPWRFTVDTDSVVVSEDAKVNVASLSKRLDCGIAMLHLEVGVLQEGFAGKWEYLKAPQVARFTPSQL